jgi:hypothetical protein
MEVLLREISESEAGTPRSLAAIYRLNAIHSPYKDITDQDMGFVLSVFMCDAKTFEKRGFAPRGLRDCETWALFQQWMYVGRAMGIRAIEAWQNFDEALAWKEAYERAHMRPHPNNALIVKATLVYYKSVLPTFLHGLLEPTVVALLEAYYPEQRAALLYDKPPAWASGLIRGTYVKSCPGGGGGGGAPRSPRRRGSLLARTQ